MAQEKMTIEQLNERVTALDRLFTSLCVVLLERKVLTPAQLEDALMLGITYAFVRDSPVAGSFAQGAASLIQMSLEHGAPPRELMRAQLEMFFRAGPEKKAALETWLRQASAEEIAEDLSEMRSSGRAPPKAAKRRPPRKR